MSVERRLTLVPRLEAMPALVSMAQRLPGKLAVLAVFALGLSLHGRPWWAEMIAILAALTLWPSQRRPLIVVASLAWLFRHASFQWVALHNYSRSCGVFDRIEGRWLEHGALLVALLACLGFHALVRRKGNAPLLRHPIALLVTLYLVLAWLATATPIDARIRVCLFAFLIAMGRMLWYLAFSVLYPQPARSSLSVVGHYLPFWLGGMQGAVPFPKAAAYLDKIECRSAEELAVCQLKAVKLLIWAGILVLLRKSVGELTDGHDGGMLSSLGIRFDLDLPSAAALLAHSASNPTSAVPVRWLALVVSFADTMLTLSIWGHVVIACCRMAGFKALRNTYRPLESTSIAEFWNRYYFYFKELMVDVFFYPTYFRVLKSHPRARRFVATLAAATFGNFLFHFLRELEHMSMVGPFGVLLAMRTYMFYCVVLGLAIGVSQLVSRRNVSDEAWGTRRLLRPAGVLAFYCLLQVFEIPGSAGVGERLSFLWSLTGAPST